MGTHDVHTESFPMNSSMTGLRCSKNLRPCALDESGLSIGSVKCNTESGTGFQGEQMILITTHVVYYHNCVGCF